MPDQDLLQNNGYLSSSDAALLYRCSKDYISRLCREGKLKGILVGRNWFIERSSFEQFLGQKDVVKTEALQKLAEVRKQEYLDAQKKREVTDTKIDNVKTTDVPTIEKVLVETPAQLVALPTPPSIVETPAVKEPTVSPYVKRSTGVESGVPLQKAVAFVLSVAFVFGTYALAQSSYPRNAVVAGAGAARSVYAALNGDSVSVRELADISGAAAVASSLTSLSTERSDFFGMRPDTTGSLFTRAYASATRSLALAFGFFTAPSASNELTLAVLPAQPKPVPASIVTPAPQTIVTITPNPVPPAPKVTSVVRVAAASDISREYVDTQLQILKNSLSSEIFKYSSQLIPGVSQAQVTLAQAQRIDRLTRTTLEASTFNNGTLNGNIFNGGNISGTSVSASDLSVSGTSYFAGGVTLSGGTLDLPYFNANSTTTASTIAYRLGIGTSSPSSTFAVQGNSYISGTSFFGGAVTATSTLTLASLTQGSALFTGAGGVVTEDNSNFYYDATNHRLGIGTSTPSRTLVVTDNKVNATVGVLLENSAIQGTNGWLLGQSCPSGCSGMGAFFIQDNTHGTVPFFISSTTPNLVGLSSTTPSQTLSVQGNSYVSGTSFFGGAITATSTLTVSGATTFSGGFASYASTTIGAGTQTTGLTIFGGATTTGNQYIAGNLGVGTAAPSDKLQVSGGDIGITGSGANLYFRGPQAANVGHAGFFDLNLMTNGVTRLTVKDAGSVGVGSTTPYGLLSVNPNGITGPAFVIGSSTKTDFIVTNAGYVGIGTTSPTQMLSVAGNIALGTGGSLYGDTTRPSLTLNTATGVTLGYAGGSNGSNSLSIGNGVLSFTTNSLERARFDVNGSFGIGTTSPYGQLSVNPNGIGTAPAFVIGSSTQTLFAVTNAGNVGIGAASLSSAGSRLYVYGNGTNGVSIDTASGSNALNFLTAGTFKWSIIPNSSDLAFYDQSGGATRLTLQNTGNLGIGTTSPSQMLSVQGNSYHSGTSFFGGAITATSTLSVTGLSTLGSLTVSGNTTLANATSTNFFSSVASSTNLFAQTGSIGTLSAQTLSVSGTTTHTGTLTQTGLATFTNGFLSNASSTITSGLFSANGGASTTNFTASGNGYFAGNVGIGTTNPLAKLSIGAGSFTDANLPVQINAASAGEAYYGANNNGAYGLLVGYENNNASAPTAGAMIRNVSSTPLYFVVNNTTNAMTILANGNVGIGTTTPTNTFAVQGTSYHSGTSFFGGAITATSTLTVSGVTTLTGGFTAFASSTIGAGGQATGLTIFGGATTTGNAYIAGTLGVGTTTPAYKLDVTGADGVGVFTAAGASQRVRFVPETSRFTIEATTASQASYAPLRFNGSTLTLASGGTDYVTLTSTGSVGIGTTSPVVQLSNTSSNITDGASVGLSGTATTFAWRHLEDGNTGYAGAFFNAGTTAGNNGLLVKINNTSSSDKILTLTSGGADRLVALGSGNIGIGTASPDDKLDIRGNLKVGSGSQLGTIAFGDNGSAATSSGAGLYVGRGLDGAFNSAALSIGGFGGIALHTSDSAGGTTTAKMVINTSGNVGIGATNPGAKLDIQGSGTNATTTIFRAGTNLGTAGQSVAIQFMESTGAVSTGAITNIAQDSTHIGLAFSAYNSGLSEAMRILGNGNVGIGTTTPSNTFAVQGTSYHSGTSFFGGAITATSTLTVSGVTTLTGGFTAFASSTIGAGGQAAGLTIWGGATTTGNAYIAGNVGVGTTTPSASAQLHVLSASSDARIRIGSSAVVSTSNTASIDLAVNTTVQERTAGFIGALLTNTTDATRTGDLFLKAVNNGVLNEVMRLTGAGNVGIGTTTPSSPLTIGTQAGGGENLRLSPTAGGAEGGQLSLMDAQGLGAFEIDNAGAAGVESLRIFRDKNSENTGTFLSIGSGGDLIVDHGALYLPNAKAVLAKDSGGTNRTLLQLYSDNITYLDGGAGGLQIRSNNAAVDAIKVLASGYVGVGTTNPATKLTISGATDAAIRVVNTTTGNSEITLYDTTDGGATIFAQDGVTNIGTVNTSGTWTANRLSINNSTGNVGVGMTPGYKLDVNGDVRGASLIVGGSGTYVAGSIYSDASWGLLMRAASAGATKAFAVHNSADTDLLSITNAGVVTVPNLTASRLVTTDGSSNLTTTISSSNLATSITDETGTGSAVFSASPTLTGTVTASVINASGAITGGTNSAFGGTTQCCAVSQTPTIAISEVGATKFPWLQFHASGYQEAYMRLATSSRLFEFGDSQAVGVGLAVMNNAGTARNVVISGNSDSYFNGGKVGIGTTTPFRKFSIVEAVATAQMTVAYDNSRYTDFLTSSVGDLTITPQGQDIFSNDANLWICTGGSCPSGTPTGTGNIIVENKIGIGTTTPAFLLTVNSTNATDNLFQIATTTNQSVFVVNATGKVGVGTSTPTQQFSIADRLFVGAGGASGMGTATSTFQGDIKITGKLDVGTIDPVYTIDGVKYATYGHSTVGIKEEAVQVLELSARNAKTGYYEKKIAFKDLEEGTDLWLFYQVTDFGKDWKNLVINLTASFDGKVFYKKVPNEAAVIISASEAGEVSARFIANRFDSQKWPNVRPDQDGGYKGHELETKLGAQGKAVGTNPSEQPFNSASF